MSDALAVRIREVVADVLNVPVEDITGTSSPDSIDAWDSLLHLNLVTALEQTFDLVFLPEEIENMLTFDAIVAQVRARATAGGPSAAASST
jgi:acyl carrier protein